MRAQKALQRCTARSGRIHVRKRPLSSLSTIANETSKELNPSAINNDLTARVLGLLSRTAGTKRYQVWQEVMGRFNESPQHGKRRKRIGILDLAQPQRSTLIDAIVGIAKENTAAREALDTRWEAMPDSTSRIVIRNGEKVSRFGPVLEIPSPTLAELDAEILEIRDIEHAANLVRTDVPVLVASSSFQPIPSIVPHLPSFLLLDPPSSHGKASPETINSQARVNHADSSSVLPRIKEKLRQSDTRGDGYRIAVLAILDECEAALKELKKDLETVEGGKQELERKVEEIVDRIRKQFESIDLSKEIQDDKEHLRGLIDPFKWYKVWEIDEVEEKLETGVRLTYGRELERKLEWYAGLMAAAQDRIKQMTEEYISTLASKLRSAQLINAIEQSESTTMTVPPSQFTAAIHYRRTQLAAISTPFLQRRFIQRVSTAMMAMPVVTGAPTILWANQMLDASTALPAAFLGLALCIRRIARSWEKGRKKWLGDYDRIQEGLTHDIEAVVAQTIDKRLCALPLVATQGSSESISQQKTAAEELAKEVEGISREVNRTL